MEQTLTVKLQIFPDAKDRQVLLDTMRAYAKACTYVSDRIRKGSLPLSCFAVHDAVYRDCRSDFSLPSQMTESVIRTTVGAIKAIRTGQRKHPGKFRKGKKKPGDLFPVFLSPQLSLVWNRDYSVIRKKGTPECLFSVNTLQGRIKVPFRKDAMAWAFADSAKFGTAQLVCRHGKFFLHVPVTVEAPEPPEPSEITDVVGIDRGIRFLTVSYDGKKTSFVSGKTVKQKRAHFKKVRQELQKRQTSSSRKRLREIGSRENRWMNDVNHCLSKALVLSHPEKTLFVLEDLTGIRSATERVRTDDRYVTVSWSYYDLEQKLKYKALRYGSDVITVDPAYTSQTCPVCGYRDKGNRNKKKHFFCCGKCGYRSNDDRIAAMNLRRMGTEYLTKALVSDKDTVLREHAPAGGASSIAPRCAASPVISQ